MPRKETAVIDQNGELEEQQETLLTPVIEEVESLDHTDERKVFTESVPKRYIANLYQEREPMAKDVFAGSYVYWESTQTITWEALNPKYSTDLELLSTSDILVTKEGRSYLISRWETPREWVQNLPWATLGERYICKDVVELYETE